MKINGKVINLNMATKNELKVKEIINIFSLDLNPSAVDAAIKQFVESNYYKHVNTYSDVQILLYILAYIGQDIHCVDLNNCLANTIDVLYALYKWRGRDYAALKEIKALLFETDLLLLDAKGKFYIHDMANLRRGFNSTTASIELTTEDGNLGNLKDFFQITLALYNEIGGGYLESETIARMESLIKSL